MKPRKFALVLLLLVALAVGGAMWLFWQTPEYTATASLLVIPGVKANAPKSVLTPSGNEVEKPKLPAAMAKDGAADSPANNTALTQAELKLTVKDMANVIRKQGAAGFNEAFFPPDSPTHRPSQLKDKLLQESTEAAALNPEVRIENDKMAQFYDYLATLTPTLNATGDKATYFGHNPNAETLKEGPSEKIAILIKVKGRWYWQTYWGDE
jgi:hypothetical protein